MDHDECRCVDGEDADGREHAQGQKRELSKASGPKRLVAAAAGLRAACVVAGVERMPARARVHGVGVVHREAGAHEAVDVVDLRAADVGHAEVVDDDLDTLVVENDIVGTALVVPAMICASCSAPRDRALLGSVRTRISPLTAASSGLVPSKSISTDSCCLRVRTTSSLLTTDFGTLLLRARITRPGTMFSTLLKMFSSSPTSFSEESSGVTSTSTRWEWSSTLITMSVNATPRSKMMYRKALTRMPIARFTRSTVMRSACSARSTPGSSIMPPG